MLDACKYLIQTHARRLPLIDEDSQTSGEVVISVLTQYRVLKFIAMNVRLMSSPPLTLHSVVTSRSTSPPVSKS